MTMSPESDQGSIFGFGGSSSMAAEKAPPPTVESVAPPTREDCDKAQSESETLKDKEQDSSHDNYRKDDADIFLQEAMDEFAQMHDTTNTCCEESLDSSEDDMLTKMWEANCQAIDDELHRQLDEQMDRAIQDQLDQQMNEYLEEALYEELDDMGRPEPPCYECDDVDVKQVLDVSLIARLTQTMQLKDNQPTVEDINADIQKVIEKHKLTEAGENKAGP